MNILDMTGQPCPIPVVEAKRAMADKATDGVEVLVDNIVAIQNLEKMALGLGYQFSYQQQDPSHFLATLLKDGSQSYDDAPTAKAPAFPVDLGLADLPADSVSGAQGPLTVLIGGSTLGRGDDQLGKLLMKGFIFSLTELDPAPEAVIFINSGAQLSCEGSNTVADLKVLEARGVTILTCGTCLNHFELTDKLAVGSITDMFGIVSRLAGGTRLLCL